MGTRNRFGNPALTPPEIQALALYSGKLPFLPNPHRDENGAPRERVRTGPSTEGSPASGRELFFGKAGCVSCHPPPLFTTDQDPATRGRFHDVGTPAHLPLHAQWQDPTNQGFPPPALTGVWDVFPLLTSGAAGLVVEEGQLRVSEKHPLRSLFEMNAESKHGNTASLTPQEREDVIAWLLAL